MIDYEIEKGQSFHMKLYRFIFWLGYILILVVAVIPIHNDLHKKTISIITIDFHVDQILHAVVYLLICLYYKTGKYFNWPLFIKNAFPKFLFLIILLATITEILQLFIPYRTFNPYDLLANIIGSFLGIIIIKYVKMTPKIL
jgi:hypothetical protein